MRIDADEYLSPGLNKALRRLAAKDEVDGYKFLWPFYDGNKTITHSWPHKLCFYRKNKVSFLGLVHFVAEVKGQIEKSNLVLSHEPLYNNFAVKTFKTKQLRWAKLQAEKYLNGFDKIEKFNFQGSGWPVSVRMRLKFPILLMPLEFIITVFNNLKSGGYREGLFGFKAAILFGFYRVAVNYYIFKLGDCKSKVG